MAVRIATAADLAATAKIAFRGFSLSPWNAFYRPHAKSYPGDVEESYRREQQDALGAKEKLFTVIEVDGANSEGHGDAESKQVVGFAIWNRALPPELEPLLLNTTADVFEGM